MAHQLDTTTGRAAMAYVGETPWHGLGSQLQPGASMAEWRKAAGLEWECRRDAVQFAMNNDPETTEGTMSASSEHHVLWRSDTGAPLSVVSSGYQIVQPSMALEFFERISETGGFALETAGVLFGGRRIWGLARAGKDAQVMDDLIRPYLLFATSYDGTLATIAQFTCIRVVCNNTLTAAIHNEKGAARFKVPHSAMFKPDEALAGLGIKLDNESWEAFALRAARLASRKITDQKMDAYLQRVLGNTNELPTDDAVLDKTRSSKGYRRIMDLFHGGQKGSGQDAIKGTAWGALNATTQYIDWEVGRLQSNRLDSAWFGAGANLKAHAAKTIEAITA